MSTAPSDPFEPPADEPNLPPAPERLTPADLRALRHATRYSYQAGDYPPDMPDHLRAYTTGDGGLLRLLDQAIEQAEQINQLRNERGWPDFKTVCQAGEELAEAIDRAEKAEARLADLIAAQVVPHADRLSNDQLRRLTDYVHPDEDTAYVRQWLQSMAAELLARRASVTDHDGRCGSEIGNPAPAEAETDR